MKIASSKYKYLEDMKAFKVGDIVFTKKVVEYMEVKILAISEDNWAMVRRKGCAPFCVMLKELKTSLPE